jgi:hypothetical protein
VAKRPARAFLSQFAEICCARAARQAVIFATTAANPLATKEMDCEQLYSRIVHRGVTKLTSIPLLLIKISYRKDACLECWAFATRSIWGGSNSPVKVDSSG